MKSLIIYFLATITILLGSNYLYASHDNEPSIIIHDNLYDKPSIFINESSILMDALQFGVSPKQIQKLIDYGENANQVYIEFLRAVNPVLRYALDRGTDEESLEIIRILIEAGADINDFTYNRDTNRENSCMMPLISYAVIYSSPEVVQIFIDAGADVNITSDCHNTPLGYAQELGKDKVAEMFEKAGAESN
jgi:hypothetical protein